MRTLSSFAAIVLVVVAARQALSQERAPTVPTKYPDSWRTERPDDARVTSFTLFGGQEPDSLPAPGASRPGS